MQCGPALRAGLLHGKGSQHHLS
uniref:Uncharacterized protein n=1 Tax=Anguilla anguilla TaxID=7936 RepID=A0A0E9RWM9_ANGAN